MSLPYQMVFSLLVFEMTVFGILVVPLPAKWKQGIVSWLNRSYIAMQFFFVLKILFWYDFIKMYAITFQLALCLFCLWADSIRGMLKTQHDVQVGRATQQHHAAFDSNLHSKLFYAQRNMYLTGFTLFLSVILTRFYHMVGELIKYEERAKAVNKQSDNNNRAMMEKVRALEKAEAKIKEMEKQVEESSKVSRDHETLKSQASNNNSQYMELANRYNEMEQKYDQLRAKMEPNEKHADVAAGLNRRSTAVKRNEE